MLMYELCVKLLVNCSFCSKNVVTKETQIHKEILGKGKH